MLSKDQVRDDRGPTRVGIHRILNKMFWVFISVFLLSYPATVIWVNIFEPNIIQDVYMIVRSDPLSAAVASIVPWVMILGISLMSAYWVTFTAVSDMKSGGTARGTFLLVARAVCCMVCVAATYPLLIVYFVLMNNLIRPS